MAQRIGKTTINLPNSPTIAAYAAVGSKKEAEGPIGKLFDIINMDSTFGQRTWEKAESELHKLAVRKALEKAKLSATDIDLIFAGDLLNQCIGANYGIRGLDVPLAGIYGACSTMAEGLALASVFVETGAATKCLASTSSHFCSAERQFRFPLEYGGQRTPTAQWTVTGAGAIVVQPNEKPPYVRAVNFGMVVDKGIKDANNMGAAMAPAAAKTIKNFFDDTQTGPDNYDLILTGDLGQVGSDLLSELLKREGVTLGKKHNDCGLIIYSNETHPDANAGGSGCGCSASVLCSYILPKIQDGSLKDILFVATGALMSTTSVQQGESIPCIAHLVHISNAVGREV